MNGYDYVEWRPGKLLLGRARIVAVSNLPSFGFSSLYQFNAETAREIEARGTPAQFTPSVWSSRLWLDIDSDQYSQEVRRKLQHENYDFVEYETGNRGRHFGILRDCEPSREVPLRDKAYVEKTFPEADASIYTALHLFRVNGAPHEKTGRIKRFVASYRGRSLRIVGISVEAKERQNALSDERQEASVFNDWYVKRYSFPNRSTDENQIDGSRHRQLVALCYALKNRQEPPEIAEWYLINVLRRFKEPKYDEQHIEEIVRSVYGA